jgi:hypothetical protein
MQVMRLSCIFLLTRLFKHMTGYMLSPSEQRQQQHPKQSLKNEKERERMSNSVRHSMQNCIKYCALLLLSVISDYERESEHKKERASERARYICPDFLLCTCKSIERETGREIKRETYHRMLIGRFFFKIAFTRLSVAEYSSGAILLMSCDGNSVLNRFESPNLKCNERAR